MERFWIAGSLLLFGACSDTMPGAQGFDLAEQPDAPQPSSTTPVVVSDVVDATPVSVSIEAPRPTDCVSEPLIVTLDLDNLTVSEPLMTETIGPDGCVDERWRRRIDDRAQVVWEEYDFFDPEIALYVYVEPVPYEHEWTYDDAGRVVRQARMDLGSETPFYTEEKTYDSRGRLLRHERLNDPLFRTEEGRGIVDVYEYVSDYEDWAVHENHYAGERTERSRQVFDERGRIVERYHIGSNDVEYRVFRQVFEGERVVSWDAWSPNIGTHLVHNDLYYREDGSLMERVEKNHQMGWLNRWTYDEAERQTEYTQDENDDGIVEYREVKQYNEFGDIVFMSTEYDFDRPQSAYSETRSTFDAEGRILESIEQPGWVRDGRRKRTTYTYDATGTGFEREMVWINANGSLTPIMSERYLDEDRLLWRRSDPGNDGTAEAIQMQSWDGDLLTAIAWDADDDGTIDSASTFHYDKARQLVAHRGDYDADGIADEQILHAR